MKLLNVLTSIAILFFSAEAEPLSEFIEISLSDQKMVYERSKIILIFKNFFSYLIVPTPLPNFPLGSFPNFANLPNIPTPPGAASTQSTTTTPRDPIGRTLKQLRCVAK